MCQESQKIKKDADTYFGGNEMIVATMGLKADTQKS